MRLCSGCCKLHSLCGCCARPVNSLVANAWKWNIFFEAFERRKFIIKKKKKVAEKKKHAIIANVKNWKSSTTDLWLQFNYQLSTLMGIFILDYHHTHLHCFQCKAEKLASFLNVKSRCKRKKCVWLDAKLKMRLSRYLEHVQNSDHISSRTFIVRRSGELI